MKKICPICNKTFKAKGNTRYCSDKCKITASINNRKDWEKRTNYKERQRQFAYMRSNNLTREQYEDTKRPRTFEDLLNDPNEDEKKRLAKIKRDAKKGDIGAMLQYYSRNEAEYWQAWRQDAIESGYLNATVNGISVNYENFASQVIESIDLCGYIHSTING